MPKNLPYPRGLPVQVCLDTGTSEHNILKKMYKSFVKYSVYKVVSPIQTKVIII